MSRSVVALLAGMLLSVSLSDPASAQSTARRASWLTDRDPFKEGDVITILVDERAAASNRHRSEDAYERGTEISAGASVAGIALPVNAAELETDHRRGERSRTETSAQDRFTAEITVTVLEVTDEGLLMVEGSRQVQVDGRTKTLLVSGMLHPQDVSYARTAHSRRLAQAKIQYQDKGKMFRAGVLGRILGALLP